MPFLSELRDLTIPVQIRRGKLVFTLDVAVEKFTPEEGQYKALREQLVQLRLQKQILNNQADEQIRAMATIADFPGIRADLVSAKAEELRNIAVLDLTTAKERNRAIRNADRDAQKAITEEDVEAEFNRRLAAAQAEAEKLQAEIQAVQRAIHSNYADRLAYLVAGADIYHDGTEDPVLSGVVEKSDEQFKSDSDFFYKTFSVQLLDHCLTKAEEAVYGPLETAASSGK
jgi:hypothetical protein